MESMHPLCACREQLHAVLQHEGLHLGNDLDVRAVVVIKELPHFIHIHATASVCQVDVVDLQSHNILLHRVQLGLMIACVPSTLQPPENASLSIVTVNAIFG